MKKVLIVSGSSQSSVDSEAMQRVKIYLQDINGVNDFEFTVSYLDDLCYVIGPGKFEVHDLKNDTKINHTDIAHIQFIKRRPVRSAYYFSRYCEWAGIDCYYDYSLFFQEGKAAQAIIFLEHGVNFLKTIYTKDNNRLVSFAAMELGYPFILKANITSHGDHNYLIKDREHAYVVLKKDPNVDFLAQQFCPNDRDYRLLLVGSEYLLFERMGGNGSHLNNTSKGAETKEVANVLPAEIINQSKRIANYLKLKIAGVDIIPEVNTGKYYFIEINAQPQLRTGALTDKKRLLVKKLYDTLR